MSKRSIKINFERFSSPNIEISVKSDRIITLISKTNTLLVFTCSSTLLGQILNATKRSHFYITFPDLLPLSHLINTRINEKRVWSLQKLWYHVSELEIIYTSRSKLLSLPLALDAFSKTLRIAAASKKEA